MKADKYDLTYRDADNNLRTVTDQDRIRWVDGGVLVRISDTLVDFVPDHQVQGLRASLPYMVNLFRAGTAWRKDLDKKLDQPKRSYQT